MIGKTIGHYRILEKIGAGGMGEVYLAEDTELERQVALKFLPAGYARDPDVLARFRREAQAAAALSHPNIITIYQVAMYEDHPYIAMEHVEGASLSDYVREHSLSVRQILDLTIQIADGLAKAHAAGVVHRDLKPDNILVDTDGRPRILDFGLAKLAGVTRITQEASTLGTLYYMSPEQTRGEDVDARSDLFSFGTILYEMIAGHLPFQGEHSTAVMYAITNENPQPLARFNNQVSDELQRIVSKLLAKDPRERYQSAADLVADLRHEARASDVAAHSGVSQGAASTAPGAHGPGTPPSGGAAAGAGARRSPMLWIGIVAVVLIVAAIVVFKPFGRKEAPVATNSRPMIAVLPFENLGVADDEYFADGVTEEITSRLATITGLGVISRTSTMRYKGTNKSLEEIAGELGVQFILEGSIRWDKSRSPERVRITPQLIRVSDDTHLWADNYERSLDAIFEVQAEIATRIAEAMEVTLLDRERKSLASVPTENAEAYAHYLRGLKLVHEGTGFATGKLENAIDAFSRATELDPGFAQAWAMLSTTQSSYYHNGMDRTPARLRQAKECADRALALDPDDATVRIAMAYYYYWGLKDYDTALAWAEKAETARPGDANTMQLFAYILRRMGRYNQCIDRLKESLTLTPQDRNAMLSLGECYIIQRQLDKAQIYFDRALALAPDDPAGYFYLALNESLRGNLEGWRRALDSFPGEDDFFMPYMSCQQHYFAREYDAAIADLDKASSPYDISEANFFPRELLRGYAYLGKGEKDAAKKEFDKAVDILNKMIAERPDDFRLYTALGYAQAGLGQRAAAVASGRKSVDMYPMSKDAYGGAWRLIEMAQIYAVAGYTDEALAQIDAILAIPCWVNAKWVRLNPNFDSIRNDPRFEEILRKHDPSA